MSNIINEGTYNLPEKLLKRAYKLRSLGYGPYTTAAKIRDEGLGDYNKTTLDRHLDHPDNVKKYTETGDYHPKNERTLKDVLKKRSNDINPEDAFKMRKNGISDAAIAKKYRVDSTALKTHLDIKHSGHPSYVPSKFKSRPKNPEDLNKSIIGMHGTINNETGEPHTYGTIAAAHGVTRSKVAGIIGRFREKGNKMESIKDRIYKILIEDNNTNKKTQSWMATRKKTMERVIASRASDAEANIPLQDTRETFRNLVIKHMDDLHTKLLSDPGLHPEAKKEIESHIKRMGQTLSKF